ncbi:MAG: hypothetical protein LBI70_01915 [Rickettsiales bacterium]|jgi:DNA polymerase-3 subunit delta'|nr:hypothetical protein [Rickettsiales bacterium]
MARFYGFEKIGENLLNALRNRKLHHCYLIQGIRGIGKSSFAQNIASVILSARGDGNEPDNSEIEKTAGLISSGGHTDFMLLNLATAEDDGGENTSKREEINVKQVRRATLHLRLTQSISNSRVMLVDSIDSVNTNGQNALLKILEEPPADTYIFLVCHNPGKVLATVKSRCSVVNVPDPTFDSWKMALQDVWQKNPRQNNYGGNLENLYNLSGHSIGLALDIISRDAQKIYENLLENIFVGNIISIQKFAENIAQENLFSLFKIFLDKFFSDIIKYCLGEHDAMDGEYVDTNRMTVFLEKNQMEKILKKYDYSRKMLRNAELYNLDKKHCISVLLGKISQGGTI